MAYGDVKSSRSSYGGGGGNSGWAEYDDEGRGASKGYWERFEAAFANSGYDCQFLLKQLPEKNPDFIYQFWRNSTYRYNKDDWADRARELVTKKCSEEVWDKFSGEILAKVKEEHTDREWMLSFWREQNYRIRQVVWDAERQARKAEQLILLEKQTTEIRDTVEATAGMLRSDFNEALRYREQYGQREGEWLDDPVAAYTSGYGFGEEVTEAVGIKLQITVSLDLSNSMYYNNIHTEAQEAYRNICLVVKELQKEHEQDIFAAFFVFSLDDSEWRTSGSKWNRRDYEVRLEGRRAYQVKAGEWDNNRDSEFYLGEMEQFRNVESYYGHFQGEDTWMYPLFTELEKWENAESDPGAIRLDIVISDAVLEHPKDIRESNVIQERRDGNLQTIVLNLMPEEHWHNGSLPFRCVQYPADKESLAGMLRNILTEFVSIHL